MRNSCYQGHKFTVMLHQQPNFTKPQINYYSHMTSAFSLAKALKGNQALLLIYACIIVQLAKLVNTLSPSKNQKCDNMFVL